MKKLVGRHFDADSTTKKTMDVGYWWPTLFKDIHDFCRSGDNYQKIGGLKTEILAKLITTFPK